MVKETGPALDMGGKTAEAAVGRGGLPLNNAMRTPMALSPQMSLGGHRRFLESLMRIAMEKFRKKNMLRENHLDLETDEAAAWGGDIGIDNGI